MTTSESAQEVIARLYTLMKKYAPRPDAVAMHVFREDSRKYCLFPKELSGYIFFVKVDNILLP